VIHQSNKGLSAARNAGLDEAQGEYVTFVDSDDYIEPDTYECVTEAINLYDPDLVFFREKSVGTDGRTIHINGSVPTGKTTAGTQNNAAGLIIGRLVNGVCDKVFRAAIIGETRFRESRIYGEDYMFNLTILPRVKKTAYIDKIKYSYVSNSGSITHRRFNANSFDQVYFKDEASAYISQFFPEYAGISCKRCFTARLAVCRQLYDESLSKKFNDKVAEYKAYMTNNYSVVKNHLTLKEKTEYFIFKRLKVLYPLFTKAVNLIKRVHLPRRLGGNDNI
jgi:glycosyltransferase involved in cell wall biosynthesis